MDQDFNALARRLGAALELRRRLRFFDAELKSTEGCGFDGCHRSEQDADAAKSNG